MINNDISYEGMFSELKDSVFAWRNYLIWHDTTFLWPFVKVLLKLRLFYLNCQHRIILRLKNANILFCQAIQRFEKTHCEKKINILLDQFTRWGYNYIYISEVKFGVKIVIEIYMLSVKWITKVVFPDNYAESFTTWRQK